MTFMTGRANRTSSPSLGIPGEETRESDAAVKGAGVGRYIFYAPLFQQPSPAPFTSTWLWPQDSQWISSDPIFLENDVMLLSYKSRTHPSCYHFNLPHPCPSRFAA